MFNGCSLYFCSPCPRATLAGSRIARAYIDISLLWFAFRLAPYYIRRLSSAVEREAPLRKSWGYTARSRVLLETHPF
jgi:hypothetical protein